MAHHKSAKTRIRRNLRRAQINGARRNRLRTYLRKVEDAIASGDKDQAQSAFKAAQPEIHRGVTKGILHRNTAARKLSRMSTRIKGL